MRENCEKNKNASEITHSVIRPLVFSSCLIKILVVNGDGRYPGKHCDSSKEESFPHRKSPIIML